VGFPRSGTTMVENILAAHSACITTDERPFTQNLVRALPGLTALDYPHALDLLDDGQCRVLRRQYWDDVRAFTGAAPGRRLLIDKQPMNMAYIGLLTRLFPGARIIVVIRDPRDVCLSCFMQAFTPNQAMSNFTTLPATVALYDRLMTFWQGVRAAIPLPLHEVRYDDAVADLEGAARGLVSFLGLDWEDDILRFNERVGDRYIQTPSYEAVSRPVYTSALERWRHYEEAIRPHREVLDRHARTLGYPTD
ncbi:MAG: sulfotransferase, partial [Phycisphaerales bacterium]|nr:sulfotransferase [Phycisphaerales bacterium]